MTALYQQVSAGILRQVQTGVLQIGDKLPREADYASELGISRSTLRLAFAELERLGVLERKKRAGTTIIANQPKPQFNMSTTGLHDLLSLGRDTELKITQTQSVKTLENPHLKDFADAKDLWLEITGTRTLPGEGIPFNATTIYVPARFSGIKPLMRPSETSVFKVIEDTFDISVGRVSQTAKAILCPTEAAQTIGIAPQAPALQIVAQLYAQDGYLMEISIATFDPERFQVRTDVEIE